jgi:hypothetical protein
MGAGDESRIVNRWRGFRVVIVECPTGDPTGRSRETKIMLKARWISAAILALLLLGGWAAGTEPASAHGWRGGPGWGGGPGWNGGGWRGGPGWNGGWRGPGWGSGPYWGGPGWGGAFYWGFPAWGVGPQMVCRPVWRSVHVRGPHGWYWRRAAVRQCFWVNGSW